jgi:hypothetical protein
LETVLKQMEGREEERAKRQNDIAKQIAKRQNGIALVLGCVSLIGAVTWYLDGKEKERLREEDGKEKERLREEDGKEKERLQSTEHHQQMAVSFLGVNFGELPSLHACDQYVSRPELESIVESYFGKPGHFLVVMGHKDGGKSTLLHQVACAHGTGN